MARKNAVDTVKAEADRYAANVLPIIREAQKAGANTLRQIAEALECPGNTNGTRRAMVRSERGEHPWQGIGGRASGLLGVTCGILWPSRGCSFASAPAEVPCVHQGQ